MEEGNGMKPNKLTPGYNIMWESSRMMLPEHKEVLRQHQQRLLKRDKPLLDEQQLVVLSQDLMLAYTNQSYVKIEIFHSYRTEFKNGHIKQIDPLQRKFQLMQQDVIEWIRLSDVLAITFL